MSEQQKSNAGVANPPQIRRLRRPHLRQHECLPVLTTTRGSLQKRSLRVAGHRTSLALEREFWSVLELIARAREVSLPVLIASIDAKRGEDTPDATLASAVRVFTLLNRP